MAYSPFLPDQRLIFLYTLTSNQSILYWYNMPFNCLFLFKIECLLKSWDYNKFKMMNFEVMQMTNRLYTIYKVDNKYLWFRSGAPFWVNLGRIELLLDVLVAGRRRCADGARPATARRRRLIVSHLQGRFAFDWFDSSIQAEKVGYSAEGRAIGSGAIHLNSGLGGVGIRGGSAQSATRVARARRVSHEQCY